MNRVSGNGQMDKVTGGLSYMTFTCRPRETPDNFRARAERQVAGVVVKYRNVGARQIVFGFEPRRMK